MLVTLALRAAALALAGLALLAPGARAHSSAASRGVSEQELRRLETATLGAAHAAEHAQQRRAARRAPRRPARPRARRAAEGPARELGDWTEARPILSRGSHGDAFGIHAAMLPTGKVMWFSYPGFPASPDARSRGLAVLWNPATGGFEDVPPPRDPRTGEPLNIWCGGQSLLSDGRLLVTGGNLRYKDGTKPAGEYGSDYAGLKVVLTFDPYEWERTRDPDRAWQRHEDMERGRWYPSQALMPDGRTAILQGLDETAILRPNAGNENNDIEVFDPGRRGDEIEKVGEIPTRHLGGLYPHTFWMPSGNLFVAGPRRSSSFFLRGPRLALDDVAAPALAREWGTGVLMPLTHDSTRGEARLIGGSPDRDAVSTATVESFSERDGAWRTLGERLSVPRSHHNTVLLPDESMVTIGGGFGKVRGAAGQWGAADVHKQVELYDPRTREWRLGPAQRENRAYHSTALLLPDGSVVSAGDDFNGGRTSDTFEIYRPPYMHREGRPTLAAAPRAAVYGSSPRVVSPDQDVDRAVLVAPGATTHAADMSQRVVRLPVAKADGGYTVTMPANPDVALPGRYMLFLVDRDGLPSTAQWVQLGREGEVQPEGVPAPAAPATPAAPAPAAPAAPAPAAPVGAAPRPPARRLRVDPGSPRAVLRVKLPSRRTLARRGRLTVRISLSEAGRLRLVPRVGNQRLVAAGKTRTVTFRRRGTRTITVRLSRSARARLLRASRVKLELFTSARDRRGNVREQRYVRRLK